MFNGLNPHGAITWVMPSGIPASAKFAVVGEQPGAMEVRNGTPFCGPAGQVLIDCLQGAQIAKGECYLTNVIKDLDAPLAHYFVGKQGEFTPAGASYVEALRQELNTVNSNVIIAVGNVALYALTSRLGITKWRGSILESTLVPGKWVIPCLHPATVIPPKNVYTNLYLIINDLKKARRVRETKDYELPSYDVIVEPSFDICMDYLKWLASFDAHAFDIEVYNHQVSCISFSAGEKAISIPFIDSKGEYFNPDREVAIWKEIGKLLEDKERTSIGQNTGFDAWFLLTKYGIKTTRIEDTMVAQHTIAPDFPKGLDFITAAYTDLPYYKADGKQWFKVGGKWKTLWHYNATDSLICDLAFPQQIAALEKAGNLETYKRQRDIIPPLVYMMHHGIKVDVEGLLAQGKKLDHEASDLEDELCKIAGYALNPNSPPQLKQYFYIEKKYRAYKSRKTGGLTVDDTALKRLVRAGSKEAAIIQKIRKLRKVESTYLQADKLDDDGRIRCSYNPVGTRFSRISSSANIFGKGMNLQNWPHSVQIYLMVDDGYIGFAIDLGQAENRIVAYYGNIVNMINAFEQGWDVHSLTATGIWPDMTWQEIKAEDNAKVPCKLGNGTHTRRYFGKRSNHALNYDLGYRDYSLQLEVVEKEGKFIYDGYHNLYPGVKNTFHKKVQDQLRSGRVVTNLLGRKTPFLGKLDNNLFKEAYACIPQGTVGDIINSRGLCYIYNNPDLFGPVELLNQVHDEIVFQIPAPWHPEYPCSWQQIAFMISMIKDSLEVPLQASGREFTIPADVTVFKRFKLGVDPKFSEDLEEFAQNIEEAWEACHEKEAKRLAQ